MQTATYSAIARRVEQLYSDDYKRAYDEVWALAYYSACSNETLQGIDVISQARNTAHAMATSAADLRHMLRGS